MDSLVDEEQLPRRAALTGAEEGRAQARLRGCAEIGVVEDDHRPVAAHLEQQRLAGGPSRDLVPGLDRSDEGNSLRAGARGHLVPDDRARPRDHAEDARRQLRVDDALGELDRADRGAGRWYPHDRVARGERRSEHLGRHRVRPVPGRDDAHDSQRDSVDEHALPGVGRRRHRPVEALRVGRGLAEVLDQLVDLGVGLGVERLALVERQRPREVVAALDDQLCDAVERRRTLERRPRRPVARGSVGSRYRPSRVLPRPFGDGADRLARRRTRCLQSRPRLALGPGAAYNHRVVARNRAHVRPREKALL